jgi:hypothetical protein
MSNPLLEPIHGVSIQDYAVISAKMAAGIDVNEICATLGIEKTIFDEACALWIARMQEDSTFEVSMEFGRFFGDPDSHPKLGSLKTEVSQEGIANIEKMKTDRYFFEELNGARQAAYNYGLDGAQWIQDKFGINLADFQSISMQWMPTTSSEEYDAVKQYLDYRLQKENEYSKIFAEDQGGNIADDVEF